ncbi:MAG: hypothetical protein AAGK77_08105 [Pseudomonadota bacterium]
MPEEQSLPCRFCVSADGTGLHPQLLDVKGRRDLVGLVLGSDFGDRQPEALRRQAGAVFFAQVLHARRGVRAFEQADGVAPSRSGQLTGDSYAEIRQRIEYKKNHRKACARWSFDRCRVVRKPPQMIMLC